MLEAGEGGVPPPPDLPVESSSPPRPAPSDSPSGTSSDRTNIADFAQMYALSRNPFGIGAILPMILLAFIGLEGFLLAINGGVFGSNPDPQVYYRLVGGFGVITTGLLLIPAVVLRGEITFDGRGITMSVGRNRIEATWDQVVGLVYTQDAGVCVKTRGQRQTRPSIRTAGGLKAADGEALIPIRLFGDRRFSILYEIRDRVPEAAWRPALEAADPPGTRRPIAVYTLAVLLGILSVTAVALHYVH